MWGDWGMGWGILGAAHMLLWWVLIILGIVVLAKLLWSGTSSADEQREDRALGLLRERYARGEIGEDEFEQKKRNLTV